MVALIDRDQADGPRGPCEVAKLVSGTPHIDREA
jgi:hypothetical protein